MYIFSGDLCVKGKICKRHNHTKLKMIFITNLCYLN